MGRGRSGSRSRSRSRGGADDSKIQRLVDDRQQARRDRDFDKADSLREELRTMGVNVDDTALTWRGPGGSEGDVNNGGGGGGGGGGMGGATRRDGDWDCPSCGKMVFASKEECFSCGTPKPRGGSGGGGRSRRDRSHSDDRRDRRRDRSYDRDRRRDDSYDRGDRRSRR